MRSAIRRPRTLRYRCGTTSAAAKTRLNGEFGRRIETTRGLADAIASLVARGAPAGDLARQAGRVAAVSADQAHRAAARLLDPSAASIAIVGDTRQYIAALRAARPDPQIVQDADAVPDSVR